MVCRMYIMLYNLFSIFLVAFSQSKQFDILDLPPPHIPYFLNSFPSLKNSCLDQETCILKEDIIAGKCWGYESGCNKSNRYSSPECPVDYSWVKSKEEQLDTFYRQVDFGYVKEQQSEMRLLCEPQVVEDSALECSQHLRFCRGRNIMINFTSVIKRKNPIRYDMDVLQDGDIGGHCKLSRSNLLDECDHLSPLQSWAPEMRFFKEIKEPIDKHCDMIVNKPTFIMKIDATVNMYHHFCDFFNLYVSQHVNLSHPDAFSKDVQIIIWESYPYFSNFAPTWEAFTSNKIWNLNSVKGKTVCFKNVVFPLLPRMIFGMFYNTPFMMGCTNSGLFKAFSEHILHRLNIPLIKRNDEKINLTFLSRNTAYRNVLNEDELLSRLKRNKQYNVQKVIFNKNVDFKKQLEVVRNSDIFIGMHGAGLTHLLFLPDWAVVFEIYNCEDPNCYKDLARLRGIKYITWEDNNLLKQQDQGHHPDGGAHAKFTNYEFDAAEFIRLIKIAISHVKKNKPTIKVKRDEL